METSAISDEVSDAGKPKSLPLDDAGKPKDLPVRTCIATRTQKPVSSMIRFVCGPDKFLVPDLKGVLPGRGVWVTATREALMQALKGRAFSHALKVDILRDAELPEKVGALLKSRALSSLSLAHKAGSVVFGMTKIDKALAAKPLALVHASDASDDGVEKLDRKFHFITEGKAPVFRFFNGAELDMAFGRSNVIHAALMTGAAGQASLEWLHRAAAFDLKSCVDEQE